MKLKYLTVMMSAFFILLPIIGCKGEKVESKINYSAITDVPETAWKALAERKIYFGHQSVGFNIMDGVQDIMAEYPKIKINIVESNDPKIVKDGMFVHSRVGSNRDPKSKIDAFSKFMDDGFGNIADIAFMKLCYVDIDAKTDIQKVFDDYKTTVDTLQKKYPKTTFVHLTAPLKVNQTSWKTTLKKLIGKTDFWEYSDNIKRNEFNQLLRAEFGNSGLFLDLAEIESMFPDGSRASFTVNDKTYYSLVPEYTYDGGHLNEAGRKKVAEQLLLLLVNQS